MDKVVIIDDSDFDRKMIMKAISSGRSTISFTELESGENAADVIAQECPKITILDIRMPGIDGFEVLAKIRSNPKFDDIPIVMISGSEEAADRAMATKHGADGYYVKPPSVAGYLSLGQNICSHYL